MGKFIDLTGKTFGRLTVRCQSRKTRSLGGQSKILWDCTCVCGTKNLEVQGQHLRSGAIQSCGCIKQELDKLRTLKHGHTTGGTTTSEFNAWAAMKSRCLNPKNISYSNYGGRNITICSRWLGDHGFENFLSDMGKKPSDLHSLDRIDNNLGYSPKNCRWATRAEQNRNQRSNRWIEFEGKTLVLQDWLNEFKSNRHQFYYQKSKGLSDQQALAYLKSRCS